MSAISIQTKKVVELTTLISPADSNMLLIHDGAALKKITFANFKNKVNASIEEEINPLLFNNAGAHNAIYRGKNLGSSVTAEQYEAIKDGSFKDLYIGDYWIISGITYRIAAFDYYYRCGDTDLINHHVVIVPDVNMYSHVMNDRSITTGGYVGSKMYKEGLESAKNTIKAAFNGHVLKHRIFLVNQTMNGKPTNGEWCNSEVDLMNENMVYGANIFSPMNDGNNIVMSFKVEKSQLPLFQHRPDMISNRQMYWLRDVVSTSLFANVSADGLSGCEMASNQVGVRPVFCIA